MEMPDLNHTLLLTIAVLVSLTRLVRLVFVALRVCVKEYCEFRNWLRANAARRRETEMERSTAGPKSPGLPPGPRGPGLLTAGPKGPALRARPGSDECDCERDESPHHVTPGASRPPAPTAVRQ